MSNSITQSLQGSIMHGFGLVNEFLNICPESVWKNKFGGWPVWQQMYHPFAALDFFLRDADAPEETPLLEKGVAELQRSPAEAPAKALIEYFIAKEQKRVANYIAGLDDTALSLKNEGLSVRFGREINHAGTLSLIASHTMYHLGSCDAALREQGLPGVF